MYQALLPKNLQSERTKPVPITPPKEKDAMEELCKKFERMEAHLANLNKRPYRPPQAYQTEQYRRPMQEQPNPNRFLRCFRCGEEGHFAMNCQTETNTRAEPSNQGRRDQDRRRTGMNMAKTDVTFREIFEDEEDTPPNIAFYPAIRKPGRPSKKPYNKEAEAGSSKGKEPVTIYKAPGFDEIDELADEDVPDIRMSESPSREVPRTRKSKTFQYNAWEDIKARPVQMTFEQAAEMNPTIKQQIRNGLTETKPGFKITQINQAGTTGSDSEEEEDWERSSAYAIGTIENVPIEFIVDTGAGGCMIAKETLDRLGWGIEAPTTLTFTTSTGHDAVPLGKVREVPVRIGEITIPIDMIVVQTTTYEVILGNDWTKKAKVVIDIDAEKMKITRRGRSSIVPISIDKGVRPAFKEVKEHNEAYVVVPTRIAEQDDTDKWTIPEWAQELMYPEEEASKPLEEEKEEDQEDIPSLQEIDYGVPEEEQFRLLTEQERATAYKLMIQEGQCAFCNTRVFCAELACDCPWTMRIQKPLKDEWRKRSTYEQREEEYIP